MVSLSIFLFYFSVLSSQAAEAQVRQEMIDYTEETLMALMDSTVPDVHYYDADGNNVTRSGNTEVEYLILEQLDLRDDGVPQDNFAFYNTTINELARDLVLVNYDFSIEVFYENSITGISHNIYIPGPRDETRDEIVSFGLEKSMLDPGKDDLVHIMFSIWRI